MGEFEEFQNELREFAKKVQGTGYTVGLELEFLYTPEVFPPRREEEKHVWDEVAAALRSTTGSYPTTKGSAKPEVHIFRRVGYNPRHHLRNVRENFVLSEDATIIPNNCGKEVGIEVSTPVMKDGSWIEIIPKMMKCLEETSRVSFNRSTGLHIHLGVGVGKSFSVPQLKKVAQAVILLERALDTLHPMRGIFKNMDRGAGFYKSISENKILEDFDMKQKIGLVSAISDEGCKEEDDPIDGDLLRLINTNNGYGEWEKNYAYNFASNEAYGTIEFRQAIGTLDARWTLDWIRRIISLVERAIHTSNAEFLDWAENGIHDKKVYESFGVPAPKTL